MSEIGKNTGLAARYLREGLLVAIPTETVYGLAALGTDPRAVLKVFEAKNRPSFDPLILHFHAIAAIEPYADLSDPRLLKLAQTFWPGPLSLLLPKKATVPDLVTSGLDRVAVRIPDQNLSLEVLKELNAPLAAPSANPFGYISPTRPEHVEKQLGNQVAYILDGGTSKVGLESTIVGIEGEELCIYRLGGLSLEEIEAVVGKVMLNLNVSSNPKAPGQLKSHYAPKKPIYLGKLNELVEKYRDKKISALVFGSGIPGNIKPFQMLNLSRSADIREAAVNLFSALREADESDSEIIVAELLPEKGLGRAINDRLKRAAA